jgi:hypothetical protein
MAVSLEEVCLRLNIIYFSIQPWNICLGHWEQSYFPRLLVSQGIFTCVGLCNHSHALITRTLTLSILETLDPTSEVGSDMTAINKPRPVSECTLHSLVNSAYPESETLYPTGVDDDVAEKLFNNFMTELVPHLPFLHFPAVLSAQDVNRKHPILFLAILAASATGVDPRLGRMLTTKLEKIYVDRVFVGGEKSMELVQALLISAVWYYPPEKFANLKFTQYAHMAANMALDIHIGMGLSSEATLAKDRDILSLETTSAGSSLTSRRTYTACYLLCSRSVSPFCDPTIGK